MFGKLRCRSKASASSMQRRFHIRRALRLCDDQLQWRVSTERVRGAELLDLHLVSVCEASVEQEWWDADLMILYHLRYMHTGRASRWRSIRSAFPVRLLWSFSIEEVLDADLIDPRLAFVCEASPQQEGLDEDLTVLHHVCASGAHLHRKSLQMQIFEICIFCLATVVCFGRRASDADPVDLHLESVYELFPYRRSVWLQI